MKRVTFTPRQRIVYHAVLRNMMFPNWNSHEAIEDVISDWRHKQTCRESVEYYMSITDKQLKRLCAEVDSKASVDFRRSR